MLQTFAPLMKAAEGLDLSDSTAAREELVRRFDPTSEAGAKLSEDLKGLLAEGKLCENGEMPVKWGRVAKAGDESLGFSIDVVHMNGPGPKHTHPQGEVNFCIALEGEPTFDGQGPGWVVFPPGSTHVPTVAGGTMLIVYLLPSGAIEFAGA